MSQFFSQLTPTDWLLLGLLVFCFVGQVGIVIYNIVKGDLRHVFNDEPTYRTTNADLMRQQIAAIQSQNSAIKRRKS